MLPPVDASDCWEKPFPSWTSGLLEYFQSHFHWLWKGEMERALHCGCALGGAVSCWQGTRGTSSLSFCTESSCRLVHSRAGFRWERGRPAAIVSMQSMGRKGLF